MDWDGKKGNEDNVGWGLKAGIDSCKESMKKKKTDYMDEMAMVRLQSMGNDRKWETGRLAKQGNLLVEFKQAS